MAQLNRKQLSKEKQKVLKKNAFANAAGALSALCYLVFYVLSSVAPEGFKVLYNAQFMGANVAPDTVVFSVPALIALGIMGWVGGYAFAWLYNRWA